MNRSKFILFAMTLLTSQLFAQDRQPKSDTREKELGALMDQLNNNNNDYREPNRNISQNSNNK